MPQVITTHTTVYTYAELSDSAKQKAHEKYGMPGDNFWSEYVIDDAKQIASLMGWNIEKVYFSGFYSQGDGACFVGTISYRKGCASAVRQRAPEDKELHRIADAWQKLQARFFYSLGAKVQHSGHYYHEYCTRFECEDTRHPYGWLPDKQAAEIEEEIKEMARDYMRWIYRQLESAYDFECSAETFAENAAANEWQFTESGEMV